MSTSSRRTSGSQSGAGNDRVEEIISILTAKHKSPKDNFEIDLALMEEYLFESGLTDSGFSRNGVYNPPNFTEAAILLQSTVEIYERKVDFLYSLVMDIVNQVPPTQRESESEHDNNPQVAGPSGRKRKQLDDIKPCSLIKLQPGNNLQESSNIRELPSLSNSFIEFEPRILSTKHFILTDLNSEDMGLISDYNINSSEVLCTNLEFSDSQTKDWRTLNGAVSLLPTPPCSTSESPRCLNETYQTLVASNNTELNLSSSTLQLSTTENVTASCLSTGSVSPEISELMNDSETILNKKSLKDNTSTCVNKPINGIDLKSALPLKNVQFCKIGPAPVPIPVLKRKVEETFDITSVGKKFLAAVGPACNQQRRVNKCLFDIDEQLLQRVINKKKHRIIKLRQQLFGSSVDTRAIDDLYVLDNFILKHSSRIQRNLHKTRIMDNIRLMCAAWEKEFTGFEDAHTNDINGFMGFTPEEQYKTHKSRQQHERVPSISSEIQLETHLENVDHDLPIETNCSDLELNNSSEEQNLNNQSDITKRVEAWHSLIRPRIEESAKRQPADIRVYIEDIIEKISGASDPVDGSMKQVPFSEIIAGKESYQVSHYFLATLTMATAGNIEIVKKNDSSENSFDVKLLSLDRRKLWTSEGEPSFNKN